MGLIACDVWTFTVSGEIWLVKPQREPQRMERILEVGLKGESAGGVVDAPSKLAVCRGLSDSASCSPLTRFGLLQTHLPVLLGQFEEAQNWTGQVTGRTWTTWPSGRMRMISLSRSGLKGSMFKGNVSMRREYCQRLNEGQRHALCFPTPWKTHGSELWKKSRYKTGSCNRTKCPEMKETTPQH